MKNCRNWLKEKSYVWFVVAILYWSNPMRILRLGSIVSMIVIPLFLAAPTVEAGPLGLPEKVSEQMMKLNLALADLSTMSGAQDTPSQVNLIIASTSSISNAAQNRKFVHSRWNRAVNYVDETYGPNAAEKFQTLGNRINRKLKEQFGPAEAARIEKKFFILFEKKFISPS